MDSRTVVDVLPLNGRAAPGNLANHVPDSPCGVQSAPSLLRSCCRTCSSAGEMKSPRRFMSLIHLACALQWIDAQTSGR